METKEILNKAVDVLRSGGLLLYPTDTVWGLGCDATDPEAVAKIFALKKREDSKSLVLLASDLGQVHKGNSGNGRAARGGKRSAYDYHIPGSDRFRAA